MHRNSGSPLRRGWDQGVVHGDQRAHRPVYLLGPTGGIAIEQGSRLLTYGEVEARSNQVARWLRAHGAGRETFVGVSIGRSPEMVIALLGILKAGAAYLPLDPAYPVARLAWMLEDTRAPIVLVGEGVDMRGVVMDAAWWAEVQAEDDGAMDSQPHPHDAAYVIYTSGSTGRPRGVVVEHANAAWYVETAADLYGLRAADRVLQFSSLCFDASVEEIFCTLSRGATLVLRDDEMLGSARTFLQRCHEARLSVLILTTAFWHEVASQVERSGLDVPQGVRLLAIGGERALPDRVAAWHERFGYRIRFFNMYGPTEATVAATAWDCSGVSRGMREVPIGRPLAGVVACVVDEAGNALPVGVDGELCLGGKGIARGYLNRPELTAERFVHLMGRRMYRTGDRARWLESGMLEFCGRLDQQVKIRGFRVEPGEIESVMASHPAVREAVVQAVDEDGTRVLAAWVAARDLEEDEMRDFLRERLPPHMIPTWTCILERLPTTPGGKVDRLALAAMRRVSAPSGAPLQGTVEERMCTVWAQVLAVEAVPRDRSFFDLGGHSLLATRLLSRIEEVFGVSLPLRTLFAHPTVAALSDVLSGGVPVEPWSALVDLQEAAGPAVFFVHSLGGDGGGGFFYYRALARRLAPGFASVGIRAPEVPFDDIEAMAAHYVVEVRKRQPHGPYRLAGYCFGGLVAYEMARQLLDTGEGVALLALFGATPPGFKSLGELLARGTALLSLKTMKRLMARLSPWGRRALSLEEVVDLSRYPVEYVQAAQAHWQASLRYTPRPCRVHALVVRCRSSLGGGSTGWEGLALGGVSVVDIPSRHETIMEHTETIGWAIETASLTPPVANCRAVG